MVHIEGEIVINRPVDEVFDFVGDERNEPRFNPNLVRVDQVTGGPIGVVTCVTLTETLRTNPSIMQLLVGRAGASPGRLAADEQTAYLDDHIWRLTPTEGRVVAVLLRAHLEGTPELQQSYVLAVAESDTPTIRRLFQRCANWEQLIVPGATKGSFRLNI